MNNAIIDFLRTKNEWNIDNLMDITGCTDKKLMKRNNRNFMNAFHALMNWKQ